MAQQGEWLTTAQGDRLYETDHSLKAGPRGPVLLQDHHLREKITHFDHERPTAYGSAGPTRENPRW
ncbi:hypothetical protein GCM10010277_08760 [Streptomyces longisporoflavus]|nr:catalase [Streptomyces longisporoflavus]GGV27297.1 hypothetical protein GCM10010277_08760 [Streptomyces longisporoflavus]